jgi:hypothetical protein
VRFFWNFQATAQSKQSPIGRKLAQSGHPATALPKAIAKIFKLRQGFSENIQPPGASSETF